MLSHRLLICGATLACATTALIGPATHASAEPHTSIVASTTVMPAPDRTSNRNEASVHHTLPVSVTSSTVAPARRSTSTSSESGATAIAVLIMIGVFFVILLPACIIQVIIYRRARKDIHDMPNYTGANGPQYGVTGYPQGTEAPGRRGIRDSARRGHTSIPTPDGRAHPDRSPRTGTVPIRYRDRATACPQLTVPHTAPRPTRDQPMATARNPPEESRRDRTTRATDAEHECAPHR